MIVRKKKKKVYFLELLQASRTVYTGYSVYSIIFSQSKLQSSSSSSSSPSKMIQSMVTARLHSGHDAFLVPQLSQHLV